VTSERILVVDDEPSVVKSCVKILELDGFAAQGVTGGAEAVERFEHEAFDLALVDLKMPEVDGLEVLKSIKASDSAAPVVIFTAYGTKENVVEALRLGASEFLEKPVEADVLVDTVRRLLAREDGGKAVHGSLSSLSLPSIIQINCEERNEARLRLRRRGQEGLLFFAQGQVVHAELGSQVGEEAVYELLRWEDGTFELEMGVSAPERTIEVGWSGLLLEGMRRIDESSAADRPHCPECGAFVDKQGRCHNPSCSRFSGDADWSPSESEFEDFVRDDDLSLDALQAVDEEDVTDVKAEYTEVDEMANLQDILKDLANDVPGFISADVVGMDGLSISGYSSNPDFDAEAASAQFALVMKLVSKTADQLGSGEVLDNLVTTEDAYVLTRFLGDGSYYLGVAVSKDMGSLGNVRLMTRNYADDIWDAIPR
jgi:DNA-binding response OmpR family regulator/predicted regulator of Ras-like GTPase activity (Roadblock/LC7/MglB family)